MCVSILSVTVFEKFLEGGWVTLVVTGARRSSSASGCARTTSHVRRDLQRLDEVLVGTPPPPGVERAARTRLSTATRRRRSSASSPSPGSACTRSCRSTDSFPNYFKNFLFVSVAVVDSGDVQGRGRDRAPRSEHRGESRAVRRVGARARPAGGLPDGHRHGGRRRPPSRSAGSSPRSIPRAIVFMGKLIFQEERWYQRLPAQRDRARRSSGGSSSAASRPWCCRSACSTADVPHVKESPARERLETLRSPSFARRRRRGAARRSSRRRALRDGGAAAPSRPTLPA